MAANANAADADVNAETWQAMLSPRTAKVSRFVDDAAKTRHLYNAWLTPHKGSVTADGGGDSTADDSNVSTLAHYAAYRRAHFHLPLACCVYAVFVGALAARGSVVLLPGLAPVFGVAFALGLVAAVAGAFSLTRKAFLSVGGVGGWSRAVQQLVVEMTRSKWDTDNIYVFTVGASLATYALASALAGPCPPGTTAWGAQSCNPAAATRGVPQDMHTLVMVAPLLAQVFFRGASKLTVVATWVAVIALYNAAHAVANAAPDTYAWVNLEFTVLLALSYEVERTMLSSFLEKVSGDVAHDEKLETWGKLVTSKCAALEKEVATKRALVKHIAHEARAPLITVMGSLIVLAEELKSFRMLLPADVHDIVATCQRSCGRVQDMLTDFVSFEKVAAGIYNLEFSYVPVLPFAHDCVRPFTAAAQAKNIDLDFQKLDCDDATVVRVDPVKMGQALRALISNAIQFTSRGGKIRVVVVCEDDVVRITVEDDGVGLECEQLEQLFRDDGHFQFNAVQGNGGSGGGGAGLGLFIARSVVKLHDGCNLWATSAGTGCGTTFHLSIPSVPRSSNVSPSVKAGGIFGSIKLAMSRRPSHAAASQRAVQPPRSTTIAPFRPSKIAPASAAVSAKSAPTRKLRILIVDDSSATRKLLVNQLSRGRYTCFEAGCGLEAVSKLRRSLIARSISRASAARPSPDADHIIGNVGEEKGTTGNDLEVYDAVVLDANLNDMTGPEVTLEIRQIGYRGPVIGLTTGGNTQTFMDAGTDCCLVKPVSIDEIVRAIEDSLRAFAVSSADVESNKASASSRPPLVVDDAVTPALESVAADVFIGKQSRGVRESSRGGVCESRMPSGRVPLASRASSRRRGAAVGGASLNASRSPSQRVVRPASGIINSMRSGGSNSKGTHAAAPRGLFVDAIRGACRATVTRKSLIDARRSSRAPSEHVAAAPSGVDAGSTSGGGGVGAMSAVDFFRQNEETLHAIEWHDLVSYGLHFVHPDIVRPFADDEERDVHEAYSTHRRLVAAWPVCAVLLVLAWVWAATRSAVGSLAVINLTFTAAAVMGWAAALVMALPFAVAAFRTALGSSYVEHATGTVWANSVVVLVALGASLSLLARAQQGQCPPGTTLWGSQACNPSAAAFEVPPDALLAVVLAVPVAQVYVGAASKYAIASSWLVVAAFVNASMAAAGSDLYLWVNVLVVAAAYVSYEYERRDAVGFAMVCLLAAAKRRDMECAAEFLSVEMTNSRMARDELKVTIASTGHDMKSPVTALTLAVESVIHTLTDGCASKDDLPPRQAQAVGTCIDAFCTVLHLNQIINRSTDYTKILGNLSLRPTLSPTSFGECLRQVATVCAAASEVPVAVRPGSDVLGEGLTDPSWLQDNLLCIIGNACKYATKSRSSASTTTSLAPVVVWGRIVMAAGVRMVEFTVQDSSSVALTADQLRALFDRPALFRRETVGGMGVGMVCLAERVKALRGDYGARPRADMDTGTEVWFRIPIEPVPLGLRPSRPSEMPQEIRPMPLERVMTRCASVMSTGGDRRNGSTTSVPSLLVTSARGTAATSDLPGGGLAATASSMEPGPSPLMTNTQQREPSANGVMLHSPSVASELSAEGRNARARPTAPPSPLAGVSVLVVDDAPSIVKMVVRMLINAGATVESAKDGAEAVDIVNEKKDRFDVVVTDIQMPRLDGYGLCKAVRRMAATGTRGQRLLIIGMSANTGPECAAKAKELGMNEFIPKPFRLQVLVDVVAAQREAERASVSVVHTAAPPTAVGTRRPSRAGQAAAGGGGIDPKPMGSDPK